MHKSIAGRRSYRADVVLVRDSKDGSDLRKSQSGSHPAPYGTDPLGDFPP